MNRRDELTATALDLVGKLYEAASDLTLWPQFLNDFAQATSSEGTVMWLHDAADSSARLEASDASFACNVRFAPGFMESYAAHYTRTNVWLKRIDTLREGEVANSSTWYPEAELRKTEYYADWLRPQGLAYALGGPVLKRGSVIAMFSLLRPERLGPYKEPDLRLMHLLMPHLRRGCLLHQRLAAARARHATSTAALDAVPSAIWILDSDGRLLYANRAGQELDRGRDGLWIGFDGRPAAVEPGDRAALSRAVDAAIAVARGRGMEGAGAVYVRRRRTDVPLQVMVYPLPSAAATVEGGAAALFITDPSRVNVQPIEAMRAQFGLTRTEAELAAALARGDSLKDYCEAHGVTANTARTHLKHLCSKTGTHRQAALVSVLTGSAPLGHRVRSGVGTSREAATRSL